MKIRLSTLILILFAVVIISSLGVNIKEGMISGDEIPPEDQDLYILKSSIVPPVCPACPSNASCPRQKPCPACPPCARCPEPAFTCKKVPNYESRGTSRELPLPMLNSFSNF
jgi:hypothetical protein